MWSALPVIGWGSRENKSGGETGQGRDKGLNLLHLYSVWFEVRNYFSLTAVRQSTYAMPQTQGTENSWLWTWTNLSSNNLFQFFFSERAVLYILFICILTLMCSTLYNRWETRCDTILSKDPGVSIWGFIWMAAFESPVFICYINIYKKNNLNFWLKFYKKSFLNTESNIRINAFFCYLNKIEH